MKEDRDDMNPVLGYIIDRGSSVAYYDENTRRSLDIEGRKKGDGDMFILTLNHWINENL